VQKTNIRTKLISFVLHVPAKTSVQFWGYEQWFLLSIPCKTSRLYQDFGFHRFSIFFTNSR